MQYHINERHRQGEMPSAKGEAYSGNHSQAAMQAAILSTLREVAPEKVYQMNETGLYFRRLPIKCERGQPVTAKDRATVILCCNSDGSHKMNLTVIGKSPAPKSFHNWLPSACSVQYLHNDCAWQTTETLGEWLQLFSSSVAERHPGQVWLVMHSSITHALPHDAEQRVWRDHVRGFAWRNANVILLPHDMSAVVPPLDQGILAAFKAGYRRRHCAFLLACYENAIETSEGGNGGAAPAKRCKVTLRQAIEWCESSWSDVTPETVITCCMRSQYEPSLALHDPKNVPEAAREAASSMSEITDNLVAMSHMLKQLQPFLGRSTCDLQDAASTSLPAPCDLNNAQLMTAHEFLAVDNACQTMPWLDLDSLVEYANTEQATAMRRKAHIEGDGDSNADTDSDEAAIPAVDTLSLSQARVSCEHLKRFVSDNSAALRTLGVGDNIGDLLNTLAGALLRMNGSAQNE